MLVDTAKAVPSAAPRYSEPSAPTLNCFAWNATAMASPQKMMGEAPSRILESRLRERNGARRNDRSEKTGSLLTMKMSPTARATPIRMAMSVLISVKYFRMNLSMHAVLSLHAEHVGSQVSCVYAGCLRKVGNQLSVVNDEDPRGKLQHFIQVR